MSKIILGIHGLSNKPAADVLYTKGWKKAMTEGLKHTSGLSNTGFDFEGIYWADKNYPNPDTKGETYRKAKKGTIKSYDEGFLEDIVSAVEVGVGDVFDWVKNRFNVDKAADKVLKSQLKDLDRYYREDGKYEELTGLVEAAVEKHQDKRIMLIGHSMGSIIAYDALRQLGARNSDVSVDHFITIGSPLGLPHVMKKICERHGSARTPTNVKRWTNFADRRDPVATDERLRDDYRGNSLGVRVEDDLVLNDWRVKNGADIFHKSYGYLRTPEFSRVLAEFV